MQVERFGLFRGNALRGNAVDVDTYQLRSAIPIDLNQRFLMRFTSRRRGRRSIGLLDMAAG